MDILVRPRDAERALETLVAAGMRAKPVPEDWLLKAFDGDILVDLVFRPAGGPIDDAYFERATPIEVSALTVPVASIDDVLVAKLLALNEQDPDFRAVLEVARALREQIDWTEVEDRSSSSPFARAFFTLGEGLGIIERRTELAPSGR